MHLTITLLCMAIVSGSLCYEDIHKYMSPEEIMRVFQTDADNIPEYEVVKLHMHERLNKRSLPKGSRFHVKAFGQHINLWLHPRDSILAGVDTPVYYAEYSPYATQGVEYRRQHGLMEMVGRAFEDPTKMAALVIGTEDSGKIRVNGYVGSHQIAIMSLPQRVVDEYNKRRGSIGDSEDPRYSPYHVVIKINANSKENHSHSPVNETRLTRSSRGIPWILYPEILVVVDNSVYRAFQTPWGHDIYGLLDYLLAFWNGVDLEYRSIETPRFRFHISAIVIAVDSYATHYIAKNMFTSKTFNISKAMQDAKHFFYGIKDTFPLDSYDIATTMTRLELGQNFEFLGMAAMASVCQRNYATRMMYAVTIYHDNGVFQGVHIAAHELGHIFGAYHDDVKCAWNDGFIMASKTKHTANASDFSPCSLKDMQISLKNQKFTCLYNRPRKDGENLPKLMPGRVKNLEAQCKSLRGGSSCQAKYPNHNVCENMFCYDKQGVCTEVGSMALDGTECGTNNEFCLHHKCVSL